MRNHPESEPRAWDAASETTRIHLRQPYARRERSRSANTRTRPVEFEGEDYRECLDVITYPTHSVREVQPRSRWLMFGDIALSSVVSKARRKKRKNVSADFEHLLKSLNRRRLEFLHCDLDLALTMTQIAALAEIDSAKRKRNLRNARRAYETVLRFRPTVNANAAENHQLRRKLIHLQTILHNLGEPSPSLPAGLSDRA